MAAGRTERALVAGSVAFSATVAPDGSVSSVDILEVALPDLGFEEGVRACVAAWRFDPAAAGASAPRSHSSRLRFSLLPDGEAGLDGRLTELASIWNSGRKKRLKELEPTADDPPSWGERKPFLADRVPDLERNVP